jgi:hypothetical protein
MGQAAVTRFYLTFPLVFVGYWLLALAGYQGRR